MPESVGLQPVHLPKRTPQGIAPEQSKVVENIGDVLTKGLGFAQTLADQSIKKEKNKLEEFGHLDDKKIEMLMTGTADGNENGDVSIRYAGNEYKIYDGTNKRFIYDSSIPQEIQDSYSSKFFKDAVTDSHTKYQDQRKDSLIDNQNIEVKKRIEYLNNAIASQKDNYSNSLFPLTGGSGGKKPINQLTYDELIKRGLNPGIGNYVTPLN